MKYTSSLLMFSILILTSCSKPLDGTLGLTSENPNMRLKLSSEENNVELIEGAAHVFEVALENDGVETEASENIVLNLTISPSTTDFSINDIPAASSYTMIMGSGESRAQFVVRASLTDSYRGNRNYDLKLASQSVANDLDLGIRIIDPKVPGQILVSQVGPPISEVNFPLSPTNLAVTEEVNLKNIGNGSVNFADFSMTGEGFSITSNSCGVSLAVEESCSVEISFVSADPGVRSGSLDFSYNNTEGDEQVSLPVAAKAVSGPVAILSSLPDPQATNLSISVQGTDLVTYRYKLGSKNSTDCTDSTGYTGLGSEISIASAITDPIGADGEYRICVLGQSATEQQAYSAPTEWTWMKDTLGPVFTSVTSNSPTGNYEAGDTITLFLNLNEPSLLTGNPSLSLNTGVDASYNASLSSTTVLAFNYLVGDEDIDSLNVDSIFALNLNGGSLQDFYSNSATLDLPFAGAGSLSETSEISIDNEAPTAPSNLNDGVQSISLTQSPNISWNPSVDNGSGIDFYEIAIGTTSGGINVLGWTNIGNVLSYQANGLSLSVGNTYYVSLRSVDKSGRVSNVSQGDGWQVTAAPPNLSLTIARSSGQSATETTLPIEFDLQFSEPINPNSLTVADFAQGGTASGITWSLTNSGDNQNYSLSATNISNPGTVIPQMLANRVQTTGGTNNDAFNSVSHSVSYEPPQAADVISTYEPEANFVDLGDFNNDGVLDYLYGDPNYDGVDGADTGRIWALSGADTSVTLFSIEGIAGEALALSFSGNVGLAAVGDINGDGIEDIAASSYRSPGLTSGVRVRAFSGADQSTLMNYTMAPPGLIRPYYRKAGDITGNGISEFYVVEDTTNDQAAIRTGAGGLNRTLNLLGTSPKIAFAGDVNGDGRGDTILSNPTFRGPDLDFIGSVVIVSGADGTYLRELEGTGSNRLGQVIDGGLDYDGDGLSDVLMSRDINVGSVFSPNWRRRIQIYSHASDQVIWNVTENESCSINFAKMIQDFDGDGYPDIVTSGCSSNFIIWSGRTRDKIFTANRSVSRVFSHDTNNDGRHELIVQSSGQLYTYQYNTTETAFCRDGFTFAHDCWFAAQNDTETCLDVCSDKGGVSYSTLGKAGLTDKSIFFTSEITKNNNICRKVSGSLGSGTIGAHSNNSTDSGCSLDDSGNINSRYGSSNVHTLSWLPPTNFKRVCACGDNRPKTIEFDSKSVHKERESINFEYVLSATLDSDLVFDWTVEPDPTVSSFLQARIPEDLPAQSGTITIPAGELTGEITVNINPLSDNTSNKSFTLSFSNFNQSVEAKEAPIGTIRGINTTRFAGYYLRSNNGGSCVDACGSKEKIDIQGMEWLKVDQENCWDTLFSFFSFAGAEGSSSASFTCALSGANFRHYTGRDLYDSSGSGINRICTCLF